MKQIISRDFIEVFPVLDEKQDMDILEICNNLINNNIYIKKQYKIIRINTKELWNNDPFNNRIWMFWTNCLIMCEYLIDGYVKSKDERYIKKALEFILSWFESNNKEILSEMTWHDHSTALRTIIICRFFEHWKKEHWNDEIAFKLKKIIEIHCEKLSDVNFYMKKHNHGLDQDIALYIACQVFSNMKKVKGWKKLVKNRLWIQVDDLFAYDGSYLEHSLSYSYFLSKRLMNFMNFIKKFGEYDFEKLKNILNKQLRFLTYMCQPNGELPPIGDGEFIPLIAEDFHLINNLYVEEFKYVSTRGNAGKKPDKLEYIFPKGGYAVFRNQWEYDENTVQIMFNSSFHSRVHKHHDDLSINLFAYGQPILIDAGKYNYNYDDENRKFVESRIAHNTVAVDGKNTNIDRLNIGKSGLENYYLSKNISLITGIQCLYEGVVHKRTIIYLKPYEVIILDFLKGYKEHDFEQIFNFYTNIECKSNEKKIIAQVNGENVAILKPLFNIDRIECSLHKGEQEPLRGWGAFEYEKIEPIWSGVYKQKGKEAKYATYIDLNNDSNVQDFEWNQDIISFNYRKNNYKIICGLDSMHLTINDKLISVINIKSDCLKKSIGESNKFEYRKKYLEERERRIKIEKYLENIVSRIEIKSLLPDKDSPQYIGQIIRWTCEAIGENLKYAWYIFKDGKKMQTTSYKESNEFVFIPKDPGEYCLKVFVKNSVGIKKTHRSMTYNIYS